MNSVSFQQGSEGGLDNVNYFNIPKPVYEIQPDGYYVILSSYVDYSNYPRKPDNEYVPPMLPDFDGDEINTHIPQTEKNAKQVVKRLRAIYVHKSYYNQNVKRKTSFVPKGQRRHY